MIGFVVDGSELAVGSDEPLQFPPEVVYRVEFGTLLGQPYQYNVQARCQLLTASGIVAGSLVQQQPDLPSRVMLAQVAQEGLEVLLALAEAAKDKPVSGARIEDAEQHPLGIAAGDGDDCLFSAKGPGIAERGKPTQHRGVEEKQHGAARHAFQAANNRPFFWARCGSLVA